MPTSDDQSAFLLEVKNKLPDNISLVDEIADVLKISTDSAYRRIRGETELSFEEIKKLSTSFDISMDALFATSYDSVLFKYRVIEHDKFDFGNYIQSVIKDLDQLSNFETKEITYMAKDLPMFYIAVFPEIAAFKMFFWQKSIFQFPEFEDKTFTPDLISNEVLGLSKQVWLKYIKIPSQEIWSNESLTAILRQIEFYYESGLIRDREVALMLTQRVGQLVDHIQKQAEVGYKFDIETETAGSENNYMLYYNELTIADNTIIYQMEDSYLVYIANNIVNILTTTDPDFCSQNVQMTNSIIRNSTLFSLNASKERNKFFQRLRDKVDEQIQGLES